MPPIVNMSTVNPLQKFVFPEGMADAASCVHERSQAGRICLFQVRLSSLHGSCTSLNSQSNSLSQNVKRRVALTAIKKTILQSQDIDVYWRRNDTI